MFGVRDINDDLGRCLASTYVCWNFLSKHISQDGILLFKICFVIEHAVDF